MDREEKRRALRAKIRAQKDGRTGGAAPTPAPSSILNDPTTALLSMGVDDMGALLNAKQLVATAKSIAHGTASARSIKPIQNRIPADQRPDPPIHEIEESNEVEVEEEAPPP